MADDARNTRFIRKAAVLDRVPVSATTLWRLTRAGDFPKPVSLSRGAVGWLESDVDHWIKTRASK